MDSWSKDLRFKSQMVRWEKLSSPSAHHLHGVMVMVKKKKNCAGSYFSICSVYILHVKDSGHFAKSAGGRLQLNTHASCVCGFKHISHCKLVCTCMVAWCTQNLRRDGSSFAWHHVTTSVDIQNALCKATVIHSESQTTRVQWVCPKLWSALGSSRDAELNKCY